MTIKRTINGTEVEIELTAEEIEQAYRQRDREYHAEDVKSYWCTMYGDCNCELECPYDDETAEAVAERAENIIEHNDGYWDYYWACFEEAIKEWEEEE